MVGGSTNLGQFFSTLYWPFLRARLQRIFLKNEIILFSQLFLFLFLVIFFVGAYIILLSIQFFSAFRVRGRLLEFFGAIFDPFFFRCFSDEEITSFPIGSIFGFSWTKMSCQSCSFNYYSCIIQFFENDEKSMEFLRSHGVLPTTVTCPLVNPYVLIEKKTENIALLKKD